MLGKHKLSLREELLYTRINYTFWNRSLTQYITDFYNWRLTRAKSLWVLDGWKLRQRQFVHSPVPDVAQKMRGVEHDKNILQKSF